MIRSIWNGPCARGGYRFQTGSDGTWSLPLCEISQPLQHLYCHWRNSAAIGLRGNYPLTNYFKDIKSLALKLRFNWSLPAMIITFMIHCKLYSCLLKPVKIEQFRKAHFSLWTLHVLQALFTYSSSEQQRNLGTEILTTHFWSLGINHDYLLLIKHQNVPASKCCHGNHYTQKMAWFTRKIKSDQIRLELSANRPTAFILYNFGCFIDTVSQSSNYVDMERQGHETEREATIALVC